MGRWIPNFGGCFAVSIVARFLVHKVEMVVFEDFGIDL